MLVDLVSSSVSMIGNLELITLNFSKNDGDDSCIWLIGSYMDWIWKACTSRKFRLKKEDLFGYLKFKYKADQLWSKMQWKSIPMLFL